MSVLCTCFPRESSNLSGDKEGFRFYLSPLLRKVIVQCLTGRVNHISGGLFVKFMRESFDFYSSTFA